MGENHGVSFNQKFDFAWTMFNSFYNDQSQMTTIGFEF